MTSRIIVRALSVAALATLGGYVAADSLAPGSNEAVAQLSISGKVLPASDATAVLDANRQAAPPEQRSVLLAGKVSLTQYQTSMKQAAECSVAGINAAAQKTGIPITASARPLETSKDKFTTGYSISYSPIGDYDISTTGPAALQQASDIQTACHAKFVDNVERSYQVAFRADAKTMGAAEQGFATCAGLQPFVANGALRSEVAYRLTNAGIDDPANAKTVECLTQYPSVISEPQIDPVDGQGLYGQ